MKYIFGIILAVAIIFGMTIVVSALIESYKEQEQRKEITVDQYEEVIKWLQDYKYLNEDTIRFMSDDKINGYEYTYLKEHVKELKLIRYKAELPYLNKVWKYHSDQDRIIFHNNWIDLSKAQKVTTNKVKD